MRSDAGSLKGQPDRKGVKVAKLRKVEKKLTATCKRSDDQMTKLYQEIEKLRSFHQGALKDGHKMHGQ